MSVSILELVGLAAITSSVGALGGLGGAILLVPLLVVLDVDPSQAAPLGLLSVAAASMSAAPRHLAEGTVNHRLGVITELAATTGAIVGVLVAGGIGERLLRIVLATVAVIAAVAGASRRGLRWQPDPSLGRHLAGERIGSLDGAYPLNDVVVPYRVSRIPLGLAAMAVSGVVAGMSGVSGGFIKTPASSEIMRAPAKVAASTTTFTVGVTAAVALVVMAAKGRIDVEPGAAVIAGALVGGSVGASLQALLPPPVVRRATSVLLLLVAAVLLAT